MWTSAGGASEVGRCDEEPRPGGRVRAGLREAAKWAAHVAATALVSPLFVLFCLRAAVSGRDQTLEGATKALELIPGMAGQYFRRAFLARALAHCHRSALIGFGVVFSHMGTSVGKNVYIGPRCHIGLAAIGPDVLLAAGVHVTGECYDLGCEAPDGPTPKHGEQSRRVRIGAGAWIGGAAVVMADVGRDTAVGTGAVVTLPLPDRVIPVGAPAHAVR
jgi:acetyltransferase-like isoleucine patch superfamily enzyme